jgi:hypothetical protein
VAITIPSVTGTLLTVVSHRLPLGLAELGRELYSWVGEP